MYNTSANDLERVANDLSMIARNYTNASEEIDQHVITLEGAVAHVLSGGATGWKGLSSEAFLGAWLERKARLQQASTIMSQSAVYLTQMARTIEDNLPAIRADQKAMNESVFHTLGVDDQASVMDEMSQAQNAILMAMSVFNSQLEALAEEVNDCPEVDQEAGDPYYYDNINRNDAGGGASGGDKTPEERIGDAVGDPVIAQELIDLANLKGANLEDVAALLEKGLTSDTIAQLFENGTNLKDALYLLNKEIEPDVVTRLINNKADLKDIGINATKLLDGGIRVKLVNGWLKNGTHLSDAIAIMEQGVDLNLLGTGPVGDLTGLEGTSVNEIVSRIPEDANIEHWVPEPGRIEEGMNFKWKDVNGKTWIVRMHEADPLAPADSNAASGWVLRVQFAGKYMDATGKFYTPNALSNPASSNYDPQGANKTHMPIQAP